MKIKINQSLVTKILTAGAVLASRFIGLIPNFSPLGSLGFFQHNFILFMGQILIFDWFFSGLYHGFIFTYLGFASYYVLGLLAKDKPKKQLLLLPLASFLFFLISNFGVWWYWYPHSWQGLLTCYTLAVPFYRNTLLGDVFFGGMILSFSIFKNFSVVKVKKLVLAKLKFILIKYPVSPAKRD